LVRAKTSLGWVFLEILRGKEAGGRVGWGWRRGVLENEGICGCKEKSSPNILSMAYRIKKNKKSWKI
jgi:hypothetical protein